MPNINVTMSNGTRLWIDTLDQELAAQWLYEALCRVYDGPYMPTTVEVRPAYNPGTQVPDWPFQLTNVSVVGITPADQGRALIVQLTKVINGPDEVGES